MTESIYPMLAVEDALALVLAQAAVLEPETVPLAAALGRVLAQDVRAAEPLPPFPASTKDGYAVCAADGPGDYPVVGEATAGRIPDFTLTPGAVAYITTGAPLPSGSDAVVMVEETEELPARGGVPYVRIAKRVEPGADVRPVGYDLGVGEVALPAGSRLGPAELGLPATVGQTQVLVVRRPRVAVISTGDELADAGNPLTPGQIRDSNRPTLLAAVTAAGGEPLDGGIVPDDQAQISARVQWALQEADILLTSGGVSMGNLDFVKLLLERLGTVHFGRLRMKPGKPLTFATVPLDGRMRLVFGLPGNPVSSLVTFYLLTAPAIRKMAGRSDPTLRRIRVTLAQPLALDPDRPEYHRASVEWDAAIGAFVAYSTGNQASSRLLSMRSANALLELPQGRDPLPAGAAVNALLIGEL